MEITRIGLLLMIVASGACPEKDENPTVDDRGDAGSLAADGGAKRTQCSFCTTGTANPQDVLAARDTLAVAFARVHLRGESALSKWLTGATLPSGVTVESR